MGFAMVNETGLPNIPLGAYCFPLTLGTPYEEGDHTVIEFKGQHEQYFIEGAIRFDEELVEYQIYDPVYDDKAGVIFHENDFVLTVTLIDGEEMLVAYSTRHTEQIELDIRKFLNNLKLYQTLLDKS